jgi:hypothetical protein
MQRKLAALTNFAGHSFIGQIRLGVVTFWEARKLVVLPSPAASSENPKLMLSSMSSSSADGKRRSYLLDYQCRLQHHLS